MLILLPPSETKRPGGDGPPLRLSSLAFPELSPMREAALQALVALSEDEDTAVRVLKLGARLRGEVAVNRAMRTAPTMPAIDRYTGVLYDALGASTLSPRARAWVGANVLIHSAPFGPVGALDAIPAYRMAANSSLPGLTPLRRLWAVPVTEALAAASPSVVVDLRSESYAALGPRPKDVPGVFVRVVTAGEDGAVRALNHFNKATKGALVRSLAADPPADDSLDGVRAHLREGGWRVEDQGDEWLLHARPH